MANKEEADERLRRALQSLNDNQRQIFDQLKTDYQNAGKRKVPNFRGGLASEIASELVLMGWRRNGESN